MASIKRIDGKGGVSFKITVSMGRDTQDKQIRHYKTWKPDRPMTERQMEKAVQRAAYEFERNITMGIQADTRQTFEQYAAYVYGLREQRGNKPQTLALVRRQTAIINELIGHMKLSDIRPQHLTELYKKLSEPGANWRQVYAAPAVDFKALVGSGTCKEFAEKCGVRGPVICRLCNNQCISVKNAEIIERSLGRKNLFKLTGTDKCLAPKTIKRYHSLIYSVLAQAEKEMLVPYNAAEKATLPPAKATRERDFLQPEQVQEVLEALKLEPLDFRTMITLFIVTGCRRGEILAIKWDNVDLNSRQIKIAGSMNYLPEYGVFEGTTKTENIRHITIPEEAADLLKQYRPWQLERRIRSGESWIDTGLLFTRSDGTALAPSLINRRLTRFCDRHGLPHIHPHTFRHTAASIMISCGVDVLTVSKMLGHANTTTTLDTYGHAIEEAKRKAAECIADALLRKKNA